MSVTLYPAAIKANVEGTYKNLAAVAEASDSNPLMNGVASPGTSDNLSRADHVHPPDTSKQHSITATGILKGDGSGGVSAAVAGTDYLTPATNYSTVNGISANYSLVANDIGKTIRIAATGDVRITFTSAVSSSMGNGAEIAFVKLTPNITVTIDMSETGGCYGFVDGEAKTFSVFRLANAYELAAVKKIFGNVNRWLVQGNVEVVS